MNQRKKRILAFICLLLVFVMVLGIILPFFVSADIIDEEEELERIQYEQQLNTALTKEQKAQLEALQKELAALEVDLVELDKQVTAVELKINDLDDKIAQKEEEIAQTENDLAIAREKEANYQVLWAERLQAMYETPSKSVLELFLTSDDFKDFWVQLEYQRAVVEYDNKVMHAIEDNRVQIEEDLVIIKEAKVVLEETLAEANEQEQELLELRQAKNTKMAAIAQKTEGVQAELQRLLVEEAELASQAAISQAKIEELKNIEEEARKYQENHLTGAYTIADTYRAACEAMWYNKAKGSNKSVYNNLKGLYFLWPLWGNVSITSNWGYRVSPIDGVYRLHDGTDIGARTGTPVHAIESGVVLKTVVSYASTGYGYYIIIKHNDTVQSWYAHLSKILVNEGDYVERGDIIGEVGSTGGATGPHLHLGLYINNVSYDPLLFVTKTYPKI